MRWLHPCLFIQKVSFFDVFLSVISCLLAEYLETDRMWTVPSVGTSMIQRKNGDPSYSTAVLEVKNSTGYLWVKKTKQNKKSPVLFTGGKFSPVSSYDALFEMWHERNEIQVWQEHLMSYFDDDLRRCAVVVSVVSFHASTTSSETDRV